MTEERSSSDGGSGSSEETSRLCEVRSDDGSYARELMRRWLRAKTPQEVLVDGNLRDVAVQCSSSLNLNTPNLNEPVVWTFDIASRGSICLTNLSVYDQNHTDCFTIKNIYGDKLNCENLYAQNLEITGQQFLHEETVFHYIVEIEFKTRIYGTFTASILFGFNKGPAIRQKLCVDVFSSADIPRLSAAYQYLQMLGNLSLNDDMTYVVPFTSEKDPEENLCSVYPEPDIHKFFLSTSTLNSKVNRHNYKRKMNELILIEELARKEHLIRFNAVVVLKLWQKYDLPRTTGDSNVTKYALPGELFAQLPLTRELSEDTKSGRLLLRSCNSLILQQVMVGPNSKSGVILGREKFEAYIEDKCSHSIYVRLSSECVKRLQLTADISVRLYVHYVMNRVPICDWLRAVDALPDTSLVFPEPQISKELKDRILEWTDDWAFDGCQLNEKQKEAVAVLMTPVKVVLPPVLILGPYGTGKTSTIAQALRILLTKNKENKIILCTHSNSAADLYIKEFFDVWHNKTKDVALKPVRIYYKGRMRSTVHPVVQKYCLLDPTGRFRDPTNDDLENCRLVITTLGTSNCLSSLDYQPTHVIIDEAAQAFECEALSCLALATKHTRLILAGDQMQLAPEVYSDLSREQGLGISILERINSIYEVNHPCRIQLCINYRSHADIVRLTSRLFYRAQVRPGAKLVGNSIYAPVTFVACEGCAVQVSNSTGFYNDTEAREIANRVVDLRKNWPERTWGPFNEESICVISHYAEQVYLIRSELRKRQLAHVSVERVLNVQGKQFAVVFISTVRTRHCISRAPLGKLSDYGFLTDEKLMNTAITRAKHVVAVFGDPVGLTTTGSCKSHWERYISEASIDGINQQDLMYHIVKASEKPDVPELNPLATEFVPREDKKVEYPYWIENVVMPVNYPVIHCVFNPTFLQ